MLNIVMGVSCAGKTTFINKKFKDYVHYSISDYQDNLKKEQGNKEFYDLLEYKSILIKANERIKNDVINALLNGDNVVMEHTLYKAKRRIAYIEDIQKCVANLEVNIYLIMPSDLVLLNNLKTSSKYNENDFKRLKAEREFIEIPNIAEGYNKIFIVKDGVINEYIGCPDEELINRAHQELFKEKKKDDEALEYNNLLNRLKLEGFYHYCEVCGKKEWLTPEQAYNDGWDYPPRIGSFGILSPRTCGNCSITDTLWWKIATNKNFDKETLTNKDIEVLRRIKKEPYSLLFNDEQ